MAEASLDLETARVLVTNDDGIHAPGLKTLERIARRLSRDVWVVAPEAEQSATSHSLTLRRPLRLRRLTRRRFTVDGTPTDCVLVAHHHIMADRPPDLVLSGINHGANLGEDVSYSGTVAAAMEAAMLGVRAVALSQMRNSDGAITWHTAETFAPRIIAALMEIQWPRDLLVNVNFPPLPPKEVTGVRACRQGRRDEGITLTEGVDPTGRPYLWIGDFLSDTSSDPDTDLGAVMEGAIAVTPLHLDLTHKSTLRRLREVFS
ncbi:MAG: 5'/3'-nucleotidase SurE [Alphaproteobacteria bacterium]|nr:MAG: 5'/3'-nucleotidase SurE [Alphaproteobacteria bacterium]